MIGAMVAFHENVWTRNPNLFTKSITNAFDVRGRRECVYKRGYAWMWSQGDFRGAFLRRETTAILITGIAIHASFVVAR